MSCITLLLCCYRLAQWPSKECDQAPTVSMPCLACLCMFSTYTAPLEFCHTLQLAAAMGYMHERGVIHGDLSRANILLMDSEDSPSGFDVKVQCSAARASLFETTTLLAMHH